MDISTVDHALTTTRSVRKRLDLSREVKREVIEECLEIAVQAPVGANIPKYFFLVVTDPVRKRTLADLYRKALDGYLEYHATEEPVFPEREAHFLESAMHLRDHLHEMPAHIIACLEGRWPSLPT